MKMTQTMSNMEEIIEKAQNRSASYIETCYIYLKECIRQYISRFLARKENQMYSDLCLDTEESFGIADAHKPHVSIYEQPGEGVIYFEFEGNSDEVLTLDELSIDVLIDIVEAIDNL